MSLQAVCERLEVSPQKIGVAIAKDLAALGYPEKFEIIGLPGGASNRGYLRVNFPGKARRQSLIVMVLRDPDFKQGVEEVVEDGFEITELPFLNVLKHFQASGVSVPVLEHYNEETGLIYIEDLGDTLLRNAIMVSDRESRKHWLKKAVDELVRLQVGSGSAQDNNFIGFRVKFNRGLLRWELEHFREWALDKRLGPVLSDAESKMLNDAFEKITDELLAAPYILSHRDYHIDNLMVVDGRIRVIDFQDAFMAPYGYDLACFMYDRDTSQILGEGLIEEIVNYNFEKLAQAGFKPLDFPGYRRVFDLCVLHRAFKVVGRFYYLAVFKKKPEYLEFMPSEYDVLGKFLDRCREFVPLKKMLQKHLPELK